MSDWVMLALIVAIPAVCTFLEWTLLNDIPERHHRHHDTYRVSNAFTHILIMVMIFMGVLGLVFFCLCRVGVFATNVHIVLAFFTAFLVVMACYWSNLHRYKVVTYRDHMFVASYLGPGKTIYYDKILRMEWGSSSPIRALKNVYVYAEDVPGRVVLRGTLDLRQILMTIDRFDVLEGTQY